MLPEIEQLLVVQDRDQRIRDLGADLERLPREEDQAKLRLSSDQQAVAGMQEAIKENEVAIKGIELDVDVRKDSIAKLKVQQFETRKNEEYQALGHEVDRYGKEIEELEDKELALMETGEVLQAQLTEAQASLAKTQEVVDTELAHIADRRKQCEAQLAETDADRKQLATAIDEDLLDEFERIFKSKKDKAVAPLEGGICQGCHMKVTPSTAGAVRAERVITRCDQCGVLLYNGEL